jgi:hypothetical protein
MYYTCRSHTGVPCGCGSATARKQGCFNDAFKKESDIIDAIIVEQNQQAEGTMKTTNDASNAEDDAGCAIAVGPDGQGFYQVSKRP